MERTAQCHCGQLKAIATGEPQSVYVCHCKACQHRTGAVVHNGSSWQKAQVRIEGAVHRIDAAESDAYFATRPPGSRLSAVASPQSRPVASRLANWNEVRELVGVMGDLGAGKQGGSGIRAGGDARSAADASRGDAASQLFARDVQRPIRLRANRVDDRVVLLGQFGRTDVLAHHDIAEEPEALVLGDILELLADRLDLRVVGSDPGAHQTPRRREHLEHVDGDVELVVGVGGFEQRGRGEESRGT